MLRYEPMPYDELTIAALTVAGPSLTGADGDLEGEAPACWSQLCRGLLLLKQACLLDMSSYASLIGHSFVSEPKKEC